MTAVSSVSADAAAAPAPWVLHGEMYIAALWQDRDSLTYSSFLPSELAPFRRGRLCYLWFVDYQDSNVGPYHELLFIPGLVRLPRHGAHPTISRICVSTQASVDNGRANWGIPKFRADFQVQRQARRTRVRYAVDGVEFGETAFTHRGPTLPFNSALLPRSLTTLVSYLHERLFFYRPTIKGQIQLAELDSMRFDGVMFPNLEGARPLFAVRLSDVTMKFPVATVLEPDVSTELLTRSA